MTAVLLESRSVRSGSWVNVPKTGAKLIFSGLYNDRLRVEFWKNMRSPVSITTDGELEIPEGCKRIRVAHTISSGSPVSVDMVR